MIFGRAVVSDYGMQNVRWLLQGREKDDGGVLWFVSDGRALERR